VLLYDVVRQHPQFLKLALRVAWRNATNLVDYNLMHGQSFPPKAVTFRISGQCNLYCQMCNFRHAGFLDSTQMLPADIFRKVIDEVYPHRLHVSLTGGEPLLHPDVVGFIRYAKERGLSCSLVTNGWSLAQFADDLVGAGLDMLTVSIDGPEEIHDKIRGRKGLHRRITEGIREVKKFEKRPLLFFSTTIQADNHAHLEQVVDDAIRVGVDGVNIQHLQTRPPARTSLHNGVFPELQVRDGWIDESLLQVDTTLLQGALYRAKQKGLCVNVFPVLSLRDIPTWYTNPMQLLPTQRIKCPWVMANVFHDGTMRTCDDIILGDLRQEGFWEIWNGEKMVRFRRQAKTSKTFPICATCCSLYRSHTI
jgi:MoaA/NifB/PqqE/SkfB family radical SAM enzyme